MAVAPDTRWKSILDNPNMPESSRAALLQWSIVNPDIPIQDKVNYAKAQLDYEIYQAGNTAESKKAAGENRAIGLYSVGQQIGAGRQADSEALLQALGARGLTGTGGSRTAGERSVDVARATSAMQRGAQAETDYAGAIAGAIMDAERRRAGLAGAAEQATAKGALSASMLAPVPSVWGTVGQVAGELAPWFYDKWTGKKKQQETGATA